MTKEKQIEEMADIIIKQNCKPCGCEDCLCAYEYGTKEESCEEYIAYRKMAEAFYDAGYRKASEVAADIVRMLRAAGINEWRYPIIAEIKKKYVEGNK